MTQLELSLREGRRRATAGIARVETHQAGFVERLRQEAIRIALEGGSVTADDVRQRAAELGLQAPHKNAWGAIFRGPGWRRVGDAASAIPTNHGHRNPRWAWTLPAQER